MCVCVCVCFKHACEDWILKCSHPLIIFDHYCVVWVFRFAFCTFGGFAVAYYRNRNLGFLLWESRAVRDSIFLSLEEVRIQLCILRLIPEILLHLHLSLSSGDRWGSADDFTTRFLHFSLSSTALWDLANSRPVHSPMLSFHLFFLSVLSSSLFHCALRDGFGQTRWTGDMSVPLHFASAYDGQEVFVWSDCLLYLGMNSLVGKCAFLTSAFPCVMGIEADIYLWVDEFCFALIGHPCLFRLALKWPQSEVVSIFTVCILLALSKTSKLKQNVCVM